MLVVSAETPGAFAFQQSERFSLRADFSWTFVGNVVYAAGQFAMLTILTKLLRPESVGQYALGLALVYPLMMLTNMQLRSVMNSAGAQATQFGDYLSLRLLMTSLVMPHRVHPGVGASAWVLRGRGSHRALSEMVHALHAHADGHAVPHGSSANWVGGGRTWIVAVDYDRGRRVFFGRPGLAWLRWNGRGGSGRRAGCSPSTTPAAGRRSRTATGQPAGISGRR